MPILLELKSLLVRSLDLDFHEVSWALRNTTEDVLDYTFQVLRSESPEGPFSELSVPFEDRYVFIDNTLQVANRWRQYYYRLRITHKRSGDVLDSEPVAQEPEPDIFAQELRRHMQLLFGEFAGRRNWVLPVRTFGQRCSCWNPVLQKKTRAGCRLCFDVGFVRGYMSPVEIWGQFDPSPKANQVTNVSKLQQSNTTARFGYYPALKPDDLIVEPENRRWRVISVSQTEQGRAAVHQEVQVHEIPPTDIEFAVPLHLDSALKDLWIAPQRNFTNPQQLENVAEDLGHLLRLYNRRPTR